MPLETATFISDLVATNPAGTDQASTLDQHDRLIKSVLKATFPNAGGAITPTVAEFNALVGALTTGAPIRVPTQSVSDSSLSAASTAFVQAVLAGLVGSAPVALWVSGTTYAAGALVYSPSNFQTYRRRSAGAGTTDPASDGTNWERMTSGGTLLYDARTSNVALVDTDFSKLVDITSGTFTQTFAAASALRNGWWVILRNSGTGDITLDPSGSETIDGLTSFVMYPGEARLIQCDGSALRSVVLTPFAKTFTASGNFVKPPGYQRFGGFMWSGGGSGARQTTGATGGGGGGCLPFFLPSSAVGATEVVTIGDGGVAVTTNVAGNAGGTTSFGSLLSQSGGGGGVAGTAGGTGSLVASTGLYNGATGGVLTGASAEIANAGSAGVYGGGGGGSGATAGATSAGGASTFGGAGGAGANGSNGAAGAAPGGGGGATRTGTSSGAGARGELRIWGM